MTRVLCTFAATYGGGILRVMTDGLPYLSAESGIDLTFADLYERNEIKSIFMNIGIRVKSAGFACPPYTSIRRGLGRQIDRLVAVPRHWQIANRLRRAARSADVLYVHTYKELALASIARIPVVWHCHGLDNVPFLTSELANRCALVIAISEAVAQKLRGIGIKRVVTVSNAIDLDRIRQAPLPSVSSLPQRTDRLVVLLPTASIRRHKGIHALLSAAQLAQGVDIWVAGNMDDPAGAEYTRSLREMADLPQLAGRVHFIGFRTDIYGVMRAADIICVPSICEEGFGLAAAEAMALGKPVIVSNRGALPEVIGGGEAGIVVDPERPAELAEALERLLTDRQFSEDLGQRAAENASKRFSYSCWAQCVSEVLKQAGDCAIAP